MRRTSHVSIALSVLLFFAACGTESGRFRLEGRFRNLNNGEFYIYSDEKADRGLDTIKVSDGRFAYETDLDDKATFVLLFPNFSEQAIFGESGATVNISGDASHLKEMEITGTDDNELMTKFRQNVNRLTPPEATKEAIRFVNDNPQSEVSLYIIQKYFVQTATPDYEQATKLLTVMGKAQKGNLKVQRMKAEVERLKAAAIGGRLPNFTATDINGRRISRADLSAKVNVVCTWASWSYDSESMLRQLHRLKKEYGDKLAVVGISLDARQKDCKSVVERDSTQWPTVCDGRVWTSPLLTTFGIGTVPTNIVADKSGKVVARDLNPQQLREKISQLLK